MQALKHEIKKIGSLSLFFFIGFGYILLLMKLFLEEYEINTYVLSKAFIGTGMLAMVLGLREHQQMLKQIQSDRYTYEPSHSAEIIGGALLVIGLVSFIGVIIRSFLDFNFSFIIV